MTARPLPLVAAAAAALCAASAQAQSSPAPRPESDELAQAFTADNLSLLCAGGTARPMAVLGEIAKNQGLNLFALPSRTEVLNLPIPANGEANAVAWLIASGNLTTAQASAAGLSQPQHEALTAIRLEFAEYLRALRAAAPTDLYRAEGPAFSDDAAGDDALLAAFFADTLGRGPAPVRIACGAPPVRTASATTGATTGATGAVRWPRARLALRGKIDDLAVAPGSGAFESASNATVAFTDNDEKGEETIAIEATLGLGANLTVADALFGFVNYVQSETETRATDDDDESKDIQAISAGGLYRRSLNFGNAVFSTVGLTGYYTYDIENEAELVRARLFLSDIVLNLPRGQLLCGGPQRLLGPLLYNCRLNAFVEGGHILDVGRSVDLADNVDDEYLGAGINPRLAFSLPTVEALAPLTLSIEWRYMAILSGALDDPERLTLRLDYKIPASNLAFGYSFEEGENLETFQPERLHKLTIGLRF